jgi:hypothetical protein
MAFYDNESTRQAIVEKLKAARTSAIFSLGKDKVKDDDDTLMYEYLRFAMKGDGDYVNGETASISTILVVAALLLNLTVVFLLTPNQYNALNGATRDTGDVSVRLAFYGNFFASACFFSCIIMGISVMMLRGAVFGEYDAPAYYWDTKKRYFSCWIFMMLGVGSFLFSVCVIIVATYNVVDAWIGVGLTIFAVISLNVVIQRSESIWQWTVVKKRLASFRTTEAYKQAFQQETKETALNLSVKS